MYKGATHRKPKLELSKAHTPHALHAHIAQPIEQFMTQRPLSISRVYVIVIARVPGIYGSK